MATLLNSSNFGLPLGSTSLSNTHVRSSQLEHTLGIRWSHVKPQFLVGLQANSGINETYHRFYQFAQMVDVGKIVVGNTQQSERSLSSACENQQKKHAEELHHAMGTYQQCRL